MSYDVGDGDFADVCRTVTRRARTTHKCSACGATISPGHYYTVTGMVWGGTAETVKRCGSCELTYQHLERIGAKVDMFPDIKLACGLDYVEEWGELPPDDIARLPLLSGAERGALLAPTKGGAS